MSYLSEYFQTIANNAGICFVDTSFVVNPKFKDEFYPALVEYNATEGNKPVKVCWLTSLVMELNRLRVNKRNEDACELGERASVALEIFFNDRSKNLIWYREEVTGMVLNPIMLGTVLGEMVGKNIYVLTANKKLSRDCLKLNRLNSVKASKNPKIIKKIRIVTIDRFGRFCITDRIADRIVDRKED